MSGRTLMIQGTSSSAGKSLLVTALCRIFARRGFRVAPFKAQNMSNNAAVCADGAEVGRSQALQAAAAGVLPTSDMNPILLKPEADNRSQTIVNGRPWKTLEARPYFQMRQRLWPHVTAALDRLRSVYDLVIIEGAGSPAEMNLQDVEIVNMAVARYAHSPVLLVGDIERGGVFAQLLGTLWLLDAPQRQLVRGLIVNKFRGDRTLFDEGVQYLQQRGGVPVLGVIPWIESLQLPEEDAVALDSFHEDDGHRVPPPPAADEAIGNRLEIAVVRLPRISNFDDFDPLAAEPQVALRYVDSRRSLGRPAAIILPGTKSTMADLQWLRQMGLADRIVALARQGVPLVGICGGYQMLGQMIRDPEHLESSIREMPGLGLLPTQTVFRGPKRTCQVQARVEVDRHCPAARGMKVEGYEIHSGRTEGSSPWLTVAEPNGHGATTADGAVSADGRIWGCHLHGLFANAGFRRAWLKTLTGQPDSATSGCDADLPEPLSAAAVQEVAIDRLADRVEASLDMQQLQKILSFQSSAAV